MEDIYSILSKHFSGVSNSEEDKQIAEFRESNPTEYEVLHKLWLKGDIEVYDFDSKDAWQKIKEKSKRKTAKTIPFYRNTRNIAAAVAILMISAITTYFLIRFGQADLVVAENLIDTPVDIELADGSVVWLSKRAVFTYPKDFKGDFREVSLSGKAFFDVTENNEFPFVINTDNSKITVLGTSFNVNSLSNTTEVAVQEGVVEVLSLINNKKLVVKENQTAVVEDKNLIRFKTKNPNYMAWKSGVFEFNNAPIIEVVRDLNTYYSNQLELDTTQVYDCSLTAKFENEELEDILEILTTTCDISVQKIDNVYKISAD